MPSACAIRRSVPRNTRRSKPDSAPEICCWCLAINFCTAFLLSLGMCSRTKRIVRRAGTPSVWLRLRRAMDGWGLVDNGGHLLVGLRGGPAAIVGFAGAIAVHGH